MKIVLCLIISFASLALAKKGFGPTEQDWGFVTVRPGADMFWWLHQTSAPVKNYTERPLVIWLQGGPGVSSTGFGNFLELGPLDEFLNPRNQTWLNYVNVLFVDNPVGTGYSTVNSTGALTTNNRQIAEDFLVLLQEFYETLPELKSTPLYIFSESYGGKMTVEIALLLDLAIKDGKLDVNLAGVALGDPWISPIDSVLTWAPYLLAVGAVDDKGYELIQQAAEDTKAVLEDEDYVGATVLFRVTQGIVEAFTADIDMYNILTKVSRDGNQIKRPLITSSTREEYQDEIDRLMNNDVKEALGLNVSWGYQSDLVFTALTEDFMKPVTELVEELLNKTDIKVAIYNGQLDLIVDTPGTMNWVENLNFEESVSWNVVTRKAFAVDDIIEGYYKKAGNLAFYWVDRAGHMVPADNPTAMQYILRDIIDDFGKK